MQINNKSNKTQKNGNLIKLKIGIYKHFNQDNKYQFHEYPLLNFAICFGGTVVFSSFVDENVKW